MGLINSIWITYTAIVPSDFFQLMSVALAIGTLVYVLVDNWI